MATALAAGASGLAVNSKISAPPNNKPRSLIARLSASTPQVCLPSTLSLVRSSGNSPLTTPTTRLHQRRATLVRAASSSAAAVPVPPPSPPPAEVPKVKWEGADLKSLAISVATGIVVWLIPPPQGVTSSAWHLLSIFLATIVGIITQPLPLGAVALMGLGACVLTRTLTFAAAFSAFGDPIPWLIALAFFFAKGFIKTGLGNRVAYQFVKLFGKTSLGLGYSLVFSEALLAPAIPSVSARAGGIFLPLVKSLCLACNSKVGDGSERRLGAWLMLTCFQTSVISSAMFLTAMAANPLSVNLATGATGLAIGWTDWAVAASVPGLLSLLVVPLLLYVLYPPTVKTSPDAPRLAREKLEKMGPISKNEWIMTSKHHRESKDGSRASTLIAEPNISLWFSPGLRVREMVLWLSQ